MCAGDGEFDPECTTGTRFRDKAQIATHQFDKMLGYGQANTSPLNIGRFATQSLKRLKQFLLAIFGNTGARVDDLDA